MKNHRAPCHDDHSFIESVSFVVASNCHPLQLSSPVEEYSSDKIDRRSKQSHIESESAANTKTLERDEMDPLGVVAFVSTGVSHHSSLVYESNKPAILDLNRDTTIRLKWRQYTERVYNEHSIVRVSLSYFILKSEFLTLSIIDSMDDCSTLTMIHCKYSRVMIG